MPKNKETIAEAIKIIPNFLEWLQKDLLVRSTDEKGIGWVINAIKTETDECRKQQEKTKNENLEEMKADNTLKLLEMNDNNLLSKYDPKKAATHHKSEPTVIGDLFGDIFNKK